MANIKDLKKYIGYEFSSGCYTGDDYKSFQTKYINFLKATCKRRQKPLLLFGIYKERGKQMRLRVNIRRSLLFRRVV